jgi:hypothetical protein
MRKQKRNPLQSGRIMALLLTGALFSCNQPAGPQSAPEEKAPPDSTLIDYSLEVDGANGEEDSTAILFAFAQALPGLSPEDISVTNATGSVTAGALSGEGAAWSLGIAVAQAGDIGVRINREGVVAGEKTLAVYKQGEQALLSWTAQANGVADTETTTTITFTFSGALTSLGPGDIRLEPGTGAASLMDLSGNGQIWIMMIAVEEAGTINISIDRGDVKSGSQSITLHQGYETPPPEKAGIAVLSPPDTTYYGRNQDFDITGLVVAWLYTDGSTDEIIPAGGYTVDQPDMGRYTPKAVKVRAGGFETSFNIQVVNTSKILQSVTASGPDNKVQELGKEFDKTGLVVTGYFSDNTTANLTSLAAIMGYDKFRRGSQAVSVKVNGKTAAVDSITTRIGEDAYLVLYTGFGVNTTFIKGKALNLEKANIMFRFSPTKNIYAAGSRELSLANGGLLPEDFAPLSAAYNPQQTGKQSFSMALDDRPFSVDCYVVDAEPDLWFDFGYMRHAGDPAGAGPGTEKYYARPNETLVIAPVRYLLGYNDDHGDAGVAYAWTVSGNADYDTSQEGELLHITPRAAGTTTITVSVTGRNYITGSTITKTASAELVCYTGALPGGTFESPLRNFGPGQMCEGGTGLGWSLGSAGGYEVWAVDSKESYSIRGNAFGVWNEPGVVWMQEDRNGNGLPDELWYELPGSEDGHPTRKNQVTRRYALTYFKAGDSGSKNEYGQIIKEVHWADSRGRTGMIPGGFPDKYWGVTGDRVTYTCTLLRDDGLIFFSSYNLAELTGYVDTVDNGIFPVSRAVRADGAPANLSAVKFIKVQTGIFRYGDIFGDVSTEISYADGLGYTTDFPMP